MWKTPEQLLEEAWKKGNKSVVPGFITIIDGYEIVTMERFQESVQYGKKRPSRRKKSPTWGTTLELLNAIQHHHRNLQIIIARAFTKEGAGKNHLKVIESTIEKLTNGELRRYKPIPKYRNIDSSWSDDDNWYYQQVWSIQ